MAVIQFLGPIKKESINIDIKSLKELKDILKKDKELLKWLKDSAIAVNDRIITDINHPIQENDVISIIPPVCGG